MNQNPVKQWENILNKPLQNQTKFLNEICSVNSKDNLVINEDYFENLSFELVKRIFDLVRKIVDSDGIDYSFQEIIFDRLLWVSEIAILYPVDKSSEDNIISGEEYYIYSTCYEDLDSIIEFINSQDSINSICDLGSGPGRALFYMALEMNRVLEYVGLELVPDRVEFTNAIVDIFNLKNVKFQTCDFLENPDKFLGFDAYYLFDPVGTDEVDLLISHFKKMIDDGAKFYIIFISGWDDLMLNELNNLKSLEKISGFDSAKQLDRYVNFYKVI